MYNDNDLYNLYKVNLSVLLNALRLSFSTWKTHEEVSIQSLMLVLIFKFKKRIVTSLEIEVLSPPLCWILSNKLITKGMRSLDDNQKYCKNNVLWLLFY